MSIASPQNRKEFKEYILHKLGKPVLEINVADEQIDLAINDAFQYFHEREHFNGTERVFYRLRVEQPLLDFFETARLQETAQSAVPQVPGAGAVDQLTLVTPGTNYTPTTDGSETRSNQPTAPANSGVTGTGLTVNWGESRTVSGGLVSVSIYSAGEGYSVGDQVIISGGNNDAVFQVTAVKDQTPLYGVEIVEQQRNWITLPDDVIGVTKVFKVGSSSNLMTGGVIPAAFFTNPFLNGGFSNSGGMQFDLVSWYTMQEYLNTLNFLLRPPVVFNFNQRTHRLHIHSNTTLRLGDYLLMECSVKPSPDVYPDIWNDMWLKKYATALVKYQWGVNLTKHTDVKLPGGITLNGEMIYNEAKQEIAEIIQKFAMDWADPVLDLVG
ncbi:neck protein [Synechococcus phage S-CRM01]|uniref:neck protein n=1 Tax=Synechococcus phage S-CRM01 TaxID=1026955 RepID=UPI000209E347|nr:neck protein [Synechococcus phage S-CRM01]AEC52976.1 neck protein [Synechococcus phage S-CRM01]